VHNELLVLSRDKDRVAAWRSGVSLHSHTRHSQEGLGFIASLLGGRNLTRRWYAYQKEQCLRTTGIALDLERGHWTPPLCERMAQDLEQRQIEGLGLRPMVSITDHNTIDACVLLREDAAHRNTPLSTEWTVPFGGAVFHFGIHNLPAASAHDLMSAMHQATFLADEERILKLFGEISETPGVLVVFNHPLWNFYSIPADRFLHELTRFLKAANRYVHAFELNGMRNHAENRGVLQLAVDWNQVLISGGDRHGCEPNASLNLTNAADFPEFVEEIRYGRQSTVAVMPQYAIPFGWRLFLNFSHVVSDYPGHPEGRQRWDERTFHPDRDGEIKPMSQLWKNGAPPAFLKTMFAMATTVAQVPSESFLQRWNRKANETLQFPVAPSWAGSARAQHGEAALEEYLYGNGEPAAD